MSQKSLARIEEISAAISKIAMDLAPVSEAQLAARRQKLLELRKELEALKLGEKGSG